MAKNTGKNAVISFGGTIYPCLTDISINGSATVVTAECSSDGTGAATTNKLTGAESWSVGATILLEGSAVTVPQAFDATTSGAVIAYPEGDETGQIGYTWTTGYIATHNVTSSPSSFMALAVTIECDGAPTIAVKGA